MNLLCSDKTGTLTEARIKLVREVDLTGAESRDVLRMAYFNAAFETGLKSPLDQAILESERRAERHDRCPCVFCSTKAQ